MNNTPVYWRDLTASNEKHAEGALMVAIGKTANNEEVTVNLYELRHLLICGVADSGKTTLVHSILNSLLAKNRPEKLRLIICDPKQVEYQPYEALAHMYTPVIVDAKKTMQVLKWMVTESDRRLGVLRKYKARTIEEYAKITENLREKTPDKAPSAMPYVVTVIDDLSILMAAYPREILGGLTMLIPNAKATGMHMLVTTPRCDAAVIPAALRERFAARITFHLPVAQSRLLVGDASAHALAEKGTAVYMPNGMTKPITLRTALITEDEIDAHTETIARMYPAERPDPASVPADQYWGKQSPLIFTFDHKEPDDELYDQAEEAVRETGKASTSYLQRKLGIGYARAARLLEMLRERGAVGPANGAAPRDGAEEDED